MLAAGCQLSSKGMAGVSSMATKRSLPRCEGPHGHALAGGMPMHSSLHVSRSGAREWGSGCAQCPGPLRPICPDAKECVGT